MRDWLLSIGSKLKAGWLWLAGGAAALIGVLTLLWNRERRLRARAEAAAKVEARAAEAEAEFRRRVEKLEAGRASRIDGRRAELRTALDDLAAKQREKPGRTPSDAWNHAHGRDEE